MYFSKNINSFPIAFLLSHDSRIKLGNSKLESECWTLFLLIFVQINNFRMATTSAADGHSHTHNVNSMCHIPGDGEECSSISSILRYCKHRVLYPYLKLLGVMGLKPWTEDDTCAFFRILNKLWVVFVILLLITGYILQFVTCFRYCSCFH